MHSLCDRAFAGADRSIVGNVPGYCSGIESGREERRSRTVVSAVNVTLKAIATELGGGTAIDYGGVITALDAIATALNPLTGAAQTIADAINGIQGGDPADLKRIADALSEQITAPLFDMAWADALIRNLVANAGMDSGGAQLILSAPALPTSLAPQ